MTDNGPNVGLDRRGVVGAAAALAALRLAPGLTLHAFAATGAARCWGLRIDIGKCPQGCEDCEGCVTACREENGWASTGRPATDAQWIRKLTLRDPATGQTREAPVSRRRPRRCALYGGARPRRQRHEQPDRLGPAACLRGLPHRLGLGRAQRRLGVVGLQPARLQALCAALGHSTHPPPDRRARDARARSRQDGAADGGGAQQQFPLDLRLEHISLHGLPRHRRRLSLRDDGSLRPALGDGDEGDGVARLRLAADPRHRRRFDLRISHRARGL